MNCWEFKKCGQEKSCPAYPYHGRRCAQLTRALCGGKVQGIFAIKLAGCLHCDFYQSVYYERTFRKTLVKSVDKTHAAPCPGN